MGIAWIAGIGLLVGALLFVRASDVSGAPAGGFLRVHPENSRYFTDGTGKAVYLTGFHTWMNLQDWGTTDPPERFDFDAYLDLLEQHNANFIRMWRWEMPEFKYFTPFEWAYYYCSPHPWARRGPGKALDGKPKFDLTRFDQAYFKRLRERVAKAARRGIYVSIMLFEGHAMQYCAEGWKFHPFNGENNVNGVNVFPKDGGRGLAFYALATPEVTRLQEAYVRQVIDTVNEFDNVLYEICNEAGGYSTQWQYHMIRFVKNYEATKAKQHPVGMTFQYETGTNANLFSSPADWISPNPEGGYRDDPLASDGKKVVISDTDHLWGLGGKHQWVWKSFTRGLNPIHMEDFGYAPLAHFEPGYKEAAEPLIRKNLGYTRLYAAKMDLAAMSPRGDLASSGYCLANPGREYLVYLEGGSSVTIDLSDVKGTAALEWFNPRTGVVTEGETVTGGTERSLKAPFDGDAVLYVAAR